MKMYAAERADVLSVGLEAVPDGGTPSPGRNIDKLCQCNLLSIYRHNQKVALTELLPVPLGPITLHRSA